MWCHPETQPSLRQPQNRSREARNLLADDGDEEMRREMRLSDEKARGMGLEALFQNGTFVILLLAVASRILVVEEIPP